jgi:preprotein translocase subunit SecA
MLNGINKRVIFLIQRRFATTNGSEIQEARELHVKENLQLSKDEIPNSENMNREAGETQQIK